MPELNSSTGTGSSVGVALIGPGRCGKVHLKNIISNPRMRVEWLVDINEEIPTTVKQDFNLDCKIATYDTIDQALQDNRIDLIVITTPTDNHPKMIETCIKNGLGQPIFCEKPISEEPEEIEHCYKLAKEANVQLMVGFNRRFDPTFRHAERMVREEAGTIQTMHAVYADAPTPPLYFLQANHESRKGIVFYDLGCHFLDLILWLLNDEMPESVYSVGHTYTPDFKTMDEPDLSMSTLYFPSGATVVLELGYSSAVGFDMRLEVRGTGGVVQADNPTLTGVKRITPEGRVCDGLESSIWERFDKSFYNQMDFMVDIAQGKAEVPITADHCVKVAKVAEAMRQSYFQKRPIYFPKPETKAEGKEVKTDEVAEEIYVH